jgi:hypothetical protein
MFEEAQKQASTQVKLSQNEHKAILERNGADGVALAYAVLGEINILNAHRKNADKIKVTIHEGGDRIVLDDPTKRLGVERVEQLKNRATDTVDHGAIPRSEARTHQLKVFKAPSSDSIELLFANRYPEQPLRDRPSEIGLPDRFPEKPNVDPKKRPE